jgi:hypothetical protein
MEKIPQKAEGEDEMFESRYTFKRTGKRITVDQGAAYFYYEITPGGQLEYQSKHPHQRTQVTIPQTEYVRVRKEAERYLKYLKERGEIPGLKDASPEPTPPQAEKPEQFKFKF